MLQAPTMRCMAGARASRRRRRRTASTTRLLCVFPGYPRHAPRSRPPPRHEPRRRAPRPARSACVAAPARRARARLDRALGDDLGDRQRAAPPRHLGDAQDACLRDATRSRPHGRVPRRDAPPCGRTAASAGVAPAPRTGRLTATTDERRPGPARGAPVRRPTCHSSAGGASCIRSPRAARRGQPAATPKNATPRSRSARARALAAPHPDREGSDPHDHPRPRASRRRADDSSGTRHGTRPGARPWPRPFGAHASPARHPRACARRRGTC